MLELQQGLSGAGPEEFAEMGRIVKAELKSDFLAAFTGEHRRSLGFQQKAVLNKILCRYAYS